MGTGDIESTKFSGDLGDLSGGDTLHVHLRDCQLQRSLAAFTTFQGRRIELAVTRLSDLKFEFAETAVDSFVFESIGVRATLI